MSSGLTSRPSLSGHDATGRNPRAARVSSGLTSRPSLSGPDDAQAAPASQPVSSGLTSRPSLSDAAVIRRQQRLEGVVGINLPTFVERRLGLSCSPRRRRVSSGLTSRPSLSGRTGCPRRIGAVRVVGINLPTFVERSNPAARTPTASRGVVGINLPTFVERPASSAGGRRSTPVSSGLTSRPSLSDGASHRHAHDGAACRRD